MENYSNYCCDEVVSDYAEQHSEKESELLHALDRETNLRTMYPRMISGHLQGELFKMLTYMIKPERVLEIGTFTGYSTICFASALPAESKIYTVEVNPEWSYISDKYFKNSGLSNKIISVIGDASEVIPKLCVNFDIVLIDANKKDNLKYYELVLPFLKSGGFILVDNVFWGGKVFDEKTNYDKDTSLIDEFNHYVTEDGRVENLLLPIRDGLMMVRKK
ncbi:MAG: O-methyltransferase [Bacteroidales bacterium]|jgi:caffeoyl-CoA O-methyltransferase|nr:O-methyltransferase [Bacteroidales bacterium]MDD2205485.1 O-methyltransferase [Bacteroidales bacterium]MDD3152749.1 O-methyltransferase [Bacteroidales bacterium]MDD3914922.1 O-methyltransferase [Bacteroidales bacterium]MDD4634774.1 O-methyltransferase [Bacteroidales bacterium]